MERELQKQEFLLDRFTVADAYLVTVLNWAQYVDVELAKWPAVEAYYTRLLKRPSVAKALVEEAQIFADEQKRRVAT